jgi:methylenetetrahydrofolate dehydrogenase (NADP+) / methenyltetrahydrofolate cyclohydrolase
MILDGKKISSEIRDELKIEVMRLREKNVVPGLAVVLVGENNASQIYVKNKEKACAQVGIHSEIVNFPENVSEGELQKKIDELNSNQKIHGILVQLPLPKSIDAKKIIESIDPEKDVDCFHPVNLGKMFLNQVGFLPCTPAGIIELLKRCNIELEGKNVTIVGRSNIVGKPLSVMLLNAGATVTTCHSKTRDLKEKCLSADILISATGKAGLIVEDMVKKNAVVVDVGMNKNAEGKLCGDVDFEKVEKKAGAITPVPGGVGPMTIALLLKNTIHSAKKKRNL